MTWKRKLAFASLAAGIFLVLLEIGFRIAFPLFGGDPSRIAGYRRFVLDGEVRFYAPHPYTDYTFNPREPDVNALGFRGPLPDLEKPPGTLRIACLGGSTTASGNSEGFKGSYPHFLQLELQERLKRPVEVLDFGVDAWTTAESLVNFVLNVRDFHPDVVIVHHAPNDGGPRRRAGFRNDYSHYRRSWAPPPKHFLDRALTRFSDLWAWLRQQNVQLEIGLAVNRPFDSKLDMFRDGHFPAGTEYPFRRNVETIVDLAHLDGARAVLATVPCTPRGARAEPSMLEGIREHNALLAEIAAAHHAILIDLAASMTDRDPELAGEFLDCVHLTPKGNRIKAQRIAAALLESGAIE